ncbi:MAG TPA: DinB family protein [Candidatus Binatia bacterium]|nr:DinB family protein [Candidatus Binatia bacterium]
MNTHFRITSADETLETTPLQMLVAHTAWANRQLFAALRDVDAFESQPGADLIARALDHIHVVRRIFQAHLHGVSHGFESTQRAVAPSLAELDRESEAIDRWYVDATASLGPGELARPRDVRFTDGNVVTMTAAAMILHVVTHTIHHRGQVDAVMIQTGMPRRRDGVPEFLVSRASAT